MKNDCIFCSIAAGETPSFKIYEDEAVVAILDINPMERAHALVIPKTHWRDIGEVPPEALGGIFASVQLVARRIEAKLGAAGYNILINKGAAAGQTVGHLHIHIIPRREGASLAFTPGPGDLAELESLAKLISAP